MSHAPAAASLLPLLPLRLNAGVPGSYAYRFFKGEAAMMAGLILVDIFNALLMLTIAAEEKAPAPAAPAAETPAEAKADTAV